MPSLYFQIYFNFSGDTVKTFTDLQITFNEWMTTYAALKRKMSVSSILEKPASMHDDMQDQMNPMLLN